jgi:hypothetical protein
MRAHVLAARRSASSSQELRALREHRPMETAEDLFEGILSKKLDPSTNANRLLKEFFRGFPLKKLRILLCSEDEQISQGFTGHEHDGELGLINSWRQYRKHLRLFVVSSRGRRDSLDKTHSSHRKHKAHS